MALIDTYRDAKIRIHQDIAKLSQDLASEQKKIAPLNRNIMAAQKTMGSTKSQSTINSKASEISRANKSIADIQTKIGEIQKKVAQKEKELAAAEKRFQIEETKENKKRIDNEKKRQRDAECQARSIEQRFIIQEKLQSQMLSDIEHIKAVPKLITVLFMAANPVDTPKLRLDEEARSIQEKIRLSEYRDSVRFESRWATRSSDVLQAINETNPTIVHFSGHGTSTGELVLQNPDGTTRVVTKEAIAAAMATASESIQLVVFNACFSSEQAENVVKNISAAIGMNDSIGDKAAIVFAAQLYSSIGFGRSLQVSFKQAIAQLLLEGIAEENTPHLYVMDGVNPNEIVLVDPNS